MFFVEASIVSSLFVHSVTARWRRYRTISIRVSGGGTGLAGVFRISFLGFSTELKAEYGKSSDVRSFFVLSVGRGGDLT
jgi:hypothetical protein